MPLATLMRSAIAGMIESAGSGMKTMLMDRDTLSMVSVSHNRNELIAKGVLYLKLISDSNASSENVEERATLAGLACVCFLRPSEDCLSVVSREVSNPRFKSYVIYFTQPIGPLDVKRLAAADDQERIKLLRSVDIDFVPLLGNVFLVGTEQCASTHLFKWAPGLMDQCVKSIMSILVGMQNFPVIRYQQSSEMCASMAGALRTALTKMVDQFVLSEDGTPLVLIVDRREDAITPMLCQWTYQAMLHELLGLQRNRVKQRLSGGPEEVNGPAQQSALEGILLNDANDSFFAENKFSNYGEIAHEISMMLEAYRIKHKHYGKVETIEDMKKFIHEFPEFKKMSKSITQHVLLISELSTRVMDNKLMDVSEVDQELASGQSLNHDDILEKVMVLLKDPNVRDIDALRLVALYSLRYEGKSFNVTDKLVSYLKNIRKINDCWIRFLLCVRIYGGLRFRQTDIFNKAFSIRKIYKSALTRGQERNIYCQHVPLIVDLVDRIISGHLDDSLYPTLHKGPNEEKCTRIVVFSVGGLTFEEVCAVNTKFGSNRNMQVILGSTRVHNFAQFIEEVLSACDNFAADQRHSAYL